MGREYETWEKDGTEFGEHNTVYLATLQEIRMGYARFGVRINQIKSNQSSDGGRLLIGIHNCIILIQNSQFTLIAL